MLIITFRAVALLCLNNTIATNSVPLPYLSNSKITSERHPIQGYHHWKIERKRKSQITQSLIWCTRRTLFPHIIYYALAATVMFNPNALSLKPVLTPPLPAKSLEATLPITMNSTGIGSLLDCTDVPLSKVSRSGRGAVPSTLRLISPTRLVPRYLVFIKLSQKVKKRP